MHLHFIAAVIIFRYSLTTAQYSCPSPCTCKNAALEDLPINSVLQGNRYKRNKPEDQQLPSYQKLNEVLDELDEHSKEEPSEEKKNLKAAICILEPQNNIELFLMLPSDLQVLMILHGPATKNITLDESYFIHLQQLVVLEIHGFPNSKGVIRLRKNALKHMENLQYINFQNLHLLGDKHVGNRPAPVSAAPFIESDSNSMPLIYEKETDNKPRSIQFISEADIVPYNIYQDQQERAGLSTFAGLQNLVFLRVFHCNIKEVSWEMFVGLKRLEFLSLEGNKIPFLNDFSFHGTPNLKRLIISHNRILSIQSVHLAGLLKLEYLDLSYNNISHLSELSLPPFPNLLTADFHHNPLNEILPYTFLIMNNTEELYLGGKPAKLKIRHNSFFGLRKLRKLSLSGLHLKVLEREHLRGMHPLRELRIEGSIKELSFDAFAEVPKLQELILKHCSIEKISMDAFLGLRSLVYLDLSHNELEILPPSLFDHQTSLKEVLLNSNKLTTLPTGLFLYSPAKLIRLDKNPWHCTCSMDEWQPSQINKIKVKIMDNSLCQTRYDKGSMCKIRYMYQYRYEQSVSPRCATPSRFSGWSVFHLLRKHLRCQEKLTKYKIHTKKEKPIRPMIQFNKSLPNVTVENSLFNLGEILVSTTSESWMEIDNNENFETSTMDSETSIKLEESNSTQNNVKQETELGLDRRGDFKTKGKLEALNGNKDQALTIEDNQNMWTKKDKDKYRLFDEKYERTMKKMNETVSAKKEKSAPVKINIDTDSKSKKQHDTLKRWEVKMEKTRKRLKTTLDNIVESR